MADPIASLETLLAQQRSITSESNRTSSNQQNASTRLRWNAGSESSAGVRSDRLEISQDAVAASQNESEETTIVLGSHEVAEMEQDFLDSLTSEAAEWAKSQGFKMRRTVSVTAQSTQRQSGPVSLFTKSGEIDEDALKELEQSGDATVREYLALIRALSKDNDSVDSFLKMIEQFQSGGAVDEGAMTEMFDQASISTGTDFTTQSLNFSASVEFKIEISMEVELNGEMISMEEFQQQIAAMGGMSDPVVLDLDGDGIELTSAGNGVEFDITGDGTTETTAFATGDDAFLALDRNGNGQIDNGRELFGDQNGAQNGLEELARYDTNGDNRIDEYDAIYDSLALFSDSNANGVSEAGELRSLREAGIASINLAYRNVDHTLSSGNRVAQLASFTTFDGRKGTVADALLNYIA
ncbi:MAG TPA: hypothetical protein PLZ55_01070 [bacterium]|nr:hypothetical protein [bacterium]HPO07229.1 hypothetical protein [bacterium]HQP99987.1 hypothetical protein [bacterium]